jgi:hypothetical protein
MGNATVKPIPPRIPVTAGKTRLCVSGFTLSHHTNRAAKLARTIVSQYPNEYESWFYFDGKGFRGKDGLLAQVKAQMNEEQKEKFINHKSSPFCWIETADGNLDCKGGRDRFCEWAAEKFPENDEIRSLAESQPSLLEAWVDECPGSCQ